MFKRILVPIDGSDLSARAIEASIELARTLGATLLGFVAEPLAPLPATPAMRPLLQQEQLEHDALTQAHATPILARFEAAAQAAGVPFEGYFDQVPNVDQAIVAAAQSHRCDLIVMVTHGRGAFGEFLFGSHTKAVLAGCKVPLLVLH
ncbi:MAG: universal stress protein [Ideonella sp.]|jgi:nucleotide-binding universal stress UspA family protein|nr:universal stress protein [Ideonella sp.]